MASSIYLLSRRFRWKPSTTKYSYVSAATGHLGRRTALPTSLSQTTLFLSQLSGDTSHPQHERKPNVSPAEVRRLALHLPYEERERLIGELQSIHSGERMSLHQGKLGRQQLRSSFGRPTKVPDLGPEEDPTGQFCEVPSNWLQKKLTEKVPKPTASQLWDVTIYNALPFIGFGFLDNTIMIVAGDYIDLTIGTVLGISTLAAAALGNTVSDIAGIGSAFYVESFSSKIGVKPPDLTLVQLEMPSSRWSANAGRAVGVTIGCLLGMFPLLFLPAKDRNEAKEERT